VSFEQKTSIVRRFRVTIFAFGAFLLLESAGTYYFSRSFLVDLREISQINQIMDFTARATDNITPARESLERLARDANFYPRESLPVYEASLNQAIHAIDSALNLSPRSDRAVRLLKDAREAVEELSRRSRITVQHLPARDRESRRMIDRELLLIRQFESDSIEFLRGAQIELSRTGNNIFSDVYGARFTPFLVSLILALLFFGFTLLFGLAITRSLKRSLDNLLQAANEVERGNLSVEVPVLTSDEIGQFTAAFDNMIRSLSRSMEEARKAVQIRDEFLSIASHELKTPITSLKMQLQFARRQIKPELNQAPSPEKLARVFDASTTQVDRLTSLIEDLLDISRIEGGKLTFNFEQTDLTQIVQNVMERFGDALTENKSKATFVPSGPVPAWCDPFRIEQVFINLLSNAIKYGGGSEVIINVITHENRARLTVRDQGMGIAPEKHELIFNRFERVSSDQNISGLGLGLYISRKMVDAHQGRLWVESELGKGSNFIMEIPQSRPA
jgi:signal transduction histidine kinase